MKKKKLRTAAIAVFALLLVASSLLRLQIEPADATVPSTALDAPSVSADSAENDLTAAEVPETPAEELPDAAADTPAELPEEGQEQPAAPAETDDVSSAVPAEDPAPEAPPAEEELKQHVCTLEIRCDTVADTTKLENQAVAPYVPEDGVILAATAFTFTPGESVFDVLLRATREKDIQMEFRDDQLYSGKYIEGINYLYEFDGGPLSGWMFHVNGQFPNHGCAAISVEDDDAIVWVYTCDLGVDVGDNSVW